MSKPLAIIYSDLHLNLWSKFNQNNQRLNNGLDIIHKVSIKAQELEVPKIFLGDLFHKDDSISNELLDKALPFLTRYFSSFAFPEKELTEKTFALSGNHDQSKNNFIDNLSPSYIKTLSKCCDNLFNIDFETFILDNGSGPIYFHGIPYITNDIGLTQEIKNIGHRYKDKKNILLLHTTLPTARDTDGREIHSHLEQNEFLKATKNFKLVLSGHIHKPEEIIKGFIYSIGAPQQQRATDRNCDMGYWILYDNLKMEFVHLNCYPRFRYYTKKPKNDYDFWIKKPKRKKKLKSNIGDIKSSISPNKVHLIAKKYCKSKSIKDKRKISALRKVLKDAI